MRGPNGGHRWRGGRVINVHGYALLYVDEPDRKYRYEHEIVGERALGRALPAGACIHHVNEQRADNRGANLVICQDQQYHNELHRKLAVLRAGGNPWAHRLCFRCHLPKNDCEFFSDRTRVSPYNPDGRRAECSACAAAWKRKLRAQRAAA
jgi:hypothetical protein